MLMKISISALFVLFSISTPVTAGNDIDDHGDMLDIIKSLKVIIHEETNTKETRAILDRIKGAKPLVKNNQYQGHQVIHNRTVDGFIGIDVRHNKPFIAVYSTPPLRIRKATRRYKDYRNLLLKHYKELEYDQFELGDQVVAHLKKQARKVTIDVYRKN